MSCSRWIAGLGAGWRLQARGWSSSSSSCLGIETVQQSSSEYSSSSPIASSSSIPVAILLSLPIDPCEPSQVWPWRVGVPQCELAEFSVGVNVCRSTYSREGRDEA